MRRRFFRNRVVRTSHMAPELYVMWTGDKLVLMPTSKDGVREELTAEEAAKRIGAEPLEIAQKNPDTWRSLFKMPPKTHPEEPIAT